jgi:predicted TIM-barrel fold metal-dependent hydrolase
MEWLPESFFSDKKLLNMLLRTIPRGYGEQVKLDTMPGSTQKQVVISKPRGFENLNYTPFHTDSKARLKAIREAGVDRAILRLPCLEEWLSSEASMKVNDLMAEYVKKHAGRVMGLAVAPPWGDDESLNELDRAIKDLHLSGVECAAHYGNLYLDAQEFRPYFKKLNKLNVPICVHHAPLPVESESLHDYSNLRRLFGRIIDQMISVSRILYSGLLDEFPNLKFVPTQMGGGLWAFTNYLKAARVGKKEDIGRFDSSPEKITRYLNRNIFFGVNMPTMWTRAQLECAIREVGADHMIFGGGYPIRLDLEEGIQQIRSLDITEQEKSLILGGNAARLFNIAA